MRMRLIPLMIVCAAALMACSPPQAASNADPLPTRTLPPATDEAPTATSMIPVDVIGAGASVPQTLYISWFDLFTYVTPRPRFTYNAVGSALGIDAILNKEVDFAASDMPLTDEQQAQAPELFTFPIAASAITIVYNLTDTEGGLIRSGLHLDANTLAEIYMGKITRWNAPEIVELNPDVALPDAEIVVMQRAPGSGSTFLFTSYLAALSPTWRTAMGAGDTMNWPIGTSVTTSAEMATTIAQTPNSLGYVDLGDARANYLTYGHVKNREGRFVEPTIESMQAAQSTTVLHMPDSMAQVIVNAPGVTSYPITGYTFVMFYSSIDDCQKAWALISWYRWSVLLGDVSAAEAGFAPLIPEVETQAFARFDQLFCNGHEPLPRLAVPLS